ILLVVSSLSAGGAERIISEMAGWWAARGRKVTVLTLSGTDQDHYRLNPKVERIALNYWGRARTPWQVIDKRIRRIMRLRRAVLSARPDIVISFMDITNVRTLTALAGTGIPVVVSERTDPRRQPVGFFWSMARRLFYPFSAALVVQTGSVAQWAQSVVPRCRTSVIPNFVRTMPDAKASHREKSMILSVGRLGREKGHDLLIRAFAAAKGAEKGWQITILGEGKERRNLENLIAGLGLTSSVHLQGIVQEPAEWMQKASFFVLSSRYEGFPNALLEAMACGCAVVVTDCPSATAEIVRNDENGLLITAENVAALSNAMVRLMEDEGLRCRLGIQALGVKELYSQDSIMAQWNNLIESILRKEDN
ncbi:MAG TPA: glycosyltransferase family 4 protein, partial [Deltaproteobacteria bacterium]|nr:glycosyltransferase family 4 protein [Deltaproteobacteria bacterium]